MIVGDPSVYCSSACFARARGAECIKLTESLANRYDISVDEEDVEKDGY